MTTQVAPLIGDEILERVSSAVWSGLGSHPRTLPPWLFYDHQGSTLFDRITELPEYYLTRTERSILAAHASEIVDAAGDNSRRLRIIELGAGSADKSRLLLLAAVERGMPVVYQPVDVSASALDAAQERIQFEIPAVEVVSRRMDYTRDLELGPLAGDERRMVAYIGSSIGNFEPDDAAALLARIQARLAPGDSILLGIDLAKDRQTMLAAYNDSAGVTAAFNRNLLVRLNRELGAEFELANFAHRAIWNPHASRIEMHLESLADHTVRIDLLDLDLEFAEGETIHTENSYKFSADAARTMLANAGFAPVATFTDPRQWFAVCLGRVPARSGGRESDL